MELEVKFRRSRQKDGGILITAVILMFVGFMICGAYLRFSSNDARLSRQAIDEQKAVVAAEAGLEYGLVKLKDLIMQYQFSPLISQAELQAMIDAIPSPDPLGAYVYESPAGDDSFRITVDSDILSGEITNGVSCRGSDGYHQYFSITCGAINKKSGYGAVLKQTVQAVGLSLIRFGVFYSEDLEILPGPRMDFYGPVHSNGRLYLGGPLYFHDRVTAHGAVYSRRKNNAARYDVARMRDAQTNMVSMKDGSAYIDSDHADWIAQSLQRWDGFLLSGAHGVSDLNPPIDPVDENHDIIERAIGTNAVAYSPATEAEKFMNKAILRIHVDSNGVFHAQAMSTNDVSSTFTNVELVVSGTNSYSNLPEYAKGSSGEYLFATNQAANAMYDITQTFFYDHRENTYMKPIDIYMDRLQESYSNLWNGVYTEGSGKGIVHITVDDPDGVSNGVMPCVRLRNGSDIKPTFGLSVVSDLPVYVEGHFNTNNTKPFLVAGDAVTMLSANWQDALSAESDKSRRVPEDTTYNTVIMTGNSETTTGNYNGGLENVMRFLEKWSGKTVTFRGSIIDLWYAEIARGSWNGSYYSPPNRDWGYDNIYRTQAPPGMTKVFGMEEILWARSTWGLEGW